MLSSESQPVSVFIRRNINYAKESRCILPILCFYKLQSINQINIGENRKTTHDTYSLFVFHIRFSIKPVSVF